MTLSIGGVAVGGTNPCRFVAEISNNHNGDLSRALRLIDAAKAAGSDFAKFQCYTPAELVGLRGDGPAPEPWGATGWTMRALYEKARTPLEWFPQLFQHARDIGIVPFSSVFGLESLVVLEQCACPAYKISKFESQDHGLSQLVWSRGKPVLISGAHHDIWPIDWLGAAWLYCPGSYPCDVASVRLPSSFHDRAYLGLSSHCLEPLLPVAAVARGCKLIEMHLMLADEPSDLESNVSLTEDQFAQMIRDVRRVEEMLA